MYKDFYNLHENPFSVTADPAFFFSSSRHSEAFSNLVYGIKERKGILVITGEIGTGKTTLCRTLLGQLGTDVKTALILNPYFSEVQLLQLIVRDLGIPETTKSKLDLINALNQFLCDQTMQGHNVVLIIDEVQHLNVRQLEQVRLLSNLETEKNKLLQIILVGQPEFLDKLKLPSLRQLNQRIAVRYHILPLDKSEIKEYIQHRLKIASRAPHSQLPVTFSDGAIQSIYLFTKGTPRLINILCDRALLAGYVSESHTIDEQLIFKCARELTQLVPTSSALGGANDFETSSLPG